MSQWSASLLVVSDIHLNHVEDSRARKLLELLGGIEESDVEYLVLMGDIFDFCLGSHPFFKRKFARIGEALERVVASGTKVIYLEGNHEFKLSSLAWKGVLFIDQGTHEIELKNGTKIQMAHGDLIYSHQMYRSFRKVVKSAFVTGLARFLPGLWMDRLATKSSEVSRAQDQYRSIDHGKILEAVDSWLETGRGDFGIFGHFHVPYAEPRRDGKSGGLVSVECWDRPNVLGFREGAFYRLFWQESGLSGWQPAEALVRG